MARIVIGGAASALIGAAPTAPAQPWPRAMLTSHQWRDLAAALPNEPDLAFEGLWAEDGQVLALFRPAAGPPLLVSAPIEANLYAALSPARPAAAWFERAVADLWGYQAAHAVDTQPLLEWGWPILHPLSPRPSPQMGSPEPAEFPSAEGDGEHLVTLGPCHGGPSGPAHLRVACVGEEARQVHTRLGYGHRGIIVLLRDKPPHVAARYVARLEAGSTVAHSLAFARAVEAALGVQVPPRAHWLRAVMAELERVRACCAALSAMAALCGSSGLTIDLQAKEAAVLRLADQLFGHRLMMDRIAPGGTAMEPDTQQLSSLQGAMDDLYAEWQATTVPALGRVLLFGAGCGVLTKEDVLRQGACGIVARAAGRNADARTWPGYAPYAAGGALETASAGDVAARTRVLAGDAQTALDTLRSLLDSLPDGDILAPMTREEGEGLAAVEAPAGTCWCWVRITGGQVAAAWLRDPAWLHWPLLDTAMRGSTASDLAAVQLSLGLTTAGVDQ